MFGRLLGGLGVIGAFTAYNCCFVVRPGERAVMYSKLSGIEDRSRTEGINFMIPYLEEPRLFNIRLRPRMLETMTGTKDLQMVNIRLRVLFRPNSEALPMLYRKYGMDYDERILPSITNEILKAVVAEFNAEDLIVKRALVSDKIRYLMQEKATKEFNLVLQDISLMDISFSKEFMVAVERKQVAHQEAERFKFVVLENEQKKLAAVIRAEGEAEAANLISGAIAKAGSGLVELRKIEAAKEIASIVAASPNISWVPEGGNMLLNMPGGPMPQQGQRVGVA